MGDAGPSERFPAPEAADQRLNGHAPGPAAASSPNAGDPARVARVQARRTLRVLRRQFAELYEHSAVHVAARLDGARVAVRRTAARLVLGALGLMSLGGVVIVASYFVLSGIARGLEPLFGNQAWIATLLTGAATLAAVAFGVRLKFVAVRERARKGTVDKYEARQTQQRTRFGRDARDRTPPPAGSSE